MRPRRFVSLRRGRRWFAAAVALGIRKRTAIRHVSVQRRKRHAVDKGCCAAAPATVADATWLELVPGYVHRAPRRGGPCFAKLRLAGLLDASSSGFWRQVAPWLSVDGCDSCAIQAAGLHVETPQVDGVAAVSALQKEGFARLRQPLPASDFSALAAGIAALRCHGAHPIWILMFDETWRLLSQMQARIFAALNIRDLQMNHDVMAWYIDPVTTEAGWPEHRDRALSVDPLDYVTCWVALTESTEQNGCVRVRPTRGAEEVLLPAEPGECLLWHGLTPHRGGRATSSAPVPRVSLSCGASRPVLEDPALRLGKDMHASFMQGALDKVTLAARVRLVALILWMNDFLLDAPASALLEEFDAAEASGKWPL
eukprot:gnl/TRDRNA2_/TRDRNA2_196316_c0_seq1.p1 gnl/TRDRNA2_/TRDRNA2_196316_c0~~gnl/TRDRNA2_/TRDRNA2_196316_c0_seq1.p1  ORF type:complete len:369 (-),score=55.16 gnl/TRDRNA2_/TRDRNA2_196316_c0_seq1:54-1160(-)